MNSNPVRKSIIMLVTFAMAFAAMVGMACDEPEGNPCVNACGITAPITSDVEQAVVDTLAGSNAQNTLSGGNP